tara:strand:+ start:33794 stop:34159 length:366 start_codon:yes stop_codon:yes gene_type:complete
MWLITQLGLFSVVLADTAPGTGQADPGQMMIRARVRGHLVALQAKRADLAAFPIVESGAGLDYRWRIVAPTAAVVEAIAALVQDVDYRNFKAAAARNRAVVGEGYLDALHAVWAEFRRMQK